MFLKLYIIALTFFLALDLVWITIVAKKLYSEGLSFLTSEHPNLIVGAIIYPLITAGLVYFVVMPARLNDSAVYTVLTGALFGAIVYGAYDLTNYSTIKKWPLSITVIDIIWGMTLLSMVALLTYIVSIRLGI